MRLCLFCDARANTKEDAWPRWLISCIGEDRTAPTEYWNTVYAPPQTWPGPKFTTKHICNGCNNGWMSKLENCVKPPMGGLINDLSFRLDAEQQRVLALWASKTAMVFEGAKQDKNRFYSAEQRQNLRKMLAWCPRFAPGFGR